jgi:hypothetical protein
MDQPLCFLYDHKTDVLSISCGHPIYTDSVALDENVILHVEPTTQKIVGFSIVDFIRRFANTETPACIPLIANFERRRRTKTRQTRRATRRG